MINQESSSRLPWRTFVAGIATAILAQRLFEIMKVSASMATIDPEHSTEA